MAGASEKGRSKADLSVVVDHEEDLPGQQVQSNEDLVGVDELAAVVRGADNKFHCPKCDFASTYKHNITRHMASKTVHPDPHGHEVSQQEGRLTMETPNEESKEGAMADDEVTAPRRKVLLECRKWCVRSATSALFSRGISGDMCKEFTLKKKKFLIL